MRKNIFKLLAISFFAIFGGTAAALVTDTQVPTAVMAATETEEDDNPGHITIDGNFAKVIELGLNDSQTFSIDVKIDEGYSLGEIIFVYDRKAFNVYADERIIDTTLEKKYNITIQSYGTPTSGENKSLGFEIKYSKNDGTITEQRYTCPKEFKIKISRNFGDWVSYFLSNNAVIILIATTCATILIRTGIKIFRFGVNYKSNFASVEQQKEFENAVRAEMRANKTETQDAVLKICLREIARETRPLKDLQSMAETLKTDREIFDVKLNSIDQKYNEIRKLSENINQLEQKVNRLQYGEGTSEVRRSGK